LFLIRFCFATLPENDSREAEAKAGREASGGSPNSRGERTNLVVSSRRFGMLILTQSNHNIPYTPPKNAEMVSPLHHAAV
jgi:hypothetical protein